MVIGPWGLCPHRWHWFHFKRVPLAPFCFLSPSCLLSCDDTARRPMPNASTLILDFSVSKTVSQWISIHCKLSSLRYFVVAAQKQTRTPSSVFMIMAILLVIYSVINLQFGLTEFTIIFKDLSWSSELSWAMFQKNLCWFMVLGGNHVKLGSSTWCTPQTRQKLAAYTELHFDFRHN